LGAETSLLGELTGQFGEFGTPVGKPRRYGYTVDGVERRASKFFEEEKGDRVGVLVGVI
jgi:hypothetical protein